MKLILENLESFTATMGKLLNNSFFDFNKCLELIKFNDEIKKNLDTFIIQKNNILKKYGEERETNNFFISPQNQIGYYNELNELLSTEIEISVFDLTMDDIKVIKEKDISITANDIKNLMLFKKEK